MTDDLEVRTEVLARCMGYANKDRALEVLPHTYYRREKQLENSHGICNECKELYWQDIATGRKNR